MRWGLFWNLTRKQALSRQGAEFADEAAVGVGVCVIGAWSWETGVILRQRERPSIVPDSRICIIPLAFINYNFVFPSGNLVVFYLYTSLYTFISFASSFCDWELLNASQLTLHLLLVLMDMTVYVIDPVLYVTSSKVHGERPQRRTVHLET